MSRSGSGRCSSRRVSPERRIAPGDGSRRCPDSCGVRRHVFEYDRPGADASSRADRHRAEHRRADADDRVILDRGMSLAALLPRPAQGDPLVHGDVVADRSGLTDDDAHTMVDEDSLTNSGSRVNLDPGDRPIQLGQQAGGQEETSAPQPVRYAVQRDGVESGRGQNRLDGRAGGWVTFPDGTNFPREQHGGGLS